MNLLDAIKTLVRGRQAKPMTHAKLTEYLNRYDEQQREEFRQEIRDAVEWLGQVKRA